MDILNESEINGRIVNYAADGESIDLINKSEDDKPLNKIEVIKQLFQRIKKIPKSKLINLLVNEGFQLEFAVEDESEEEDEESVLQEELLGTDQEYLKLPIEKKKSLSDEAKSRYEKKLQSKPVSYIREKLLDELHSDYISEWLTENLGERTFITIKLKNYEHIWNPFYIPSKYKDQYKTVTMDHAHILNLLRAETATGRLACYGLTSDALKYMRKDPPLEKILALKPGKKELQFDSMNQKAAEYLFSERSVDILKKDGFEAAAEFIEAVGEGLIDAIDRSGIQIEERIRKAEKLKTKLESQVNILDFIHRPKHGLTTELFTMIESRLDSIIFSYCNTDKIEARKLSTLMVENSFSVLR